ncbi:hypothetical protein F4679DRAFT_458079 [Xylaria curta]|nr:hypothetical protein F4679DRAFT_458079 [Xylaria curta]
MLMRRTNMLRASLNTSRNPCGSWTSISVPMSDLSVYPNILGYLKQCIECIGYRRARAKGDSDLVLMIDDKLSTGTYRS